MHTPMANPNDLLLWMLLLHVSSLEDLVGLADSPYVDRPILMCEYAHGMVFFEQP